MAAWRSLRTASRARPTARIAASSPRGLATGLSSPDRRTRAHWTASRRAVLTCSPAFGGLGAGATTPHVSSFFVRERDTPSPQGPASDTQCRGLPFDGHLRSKVSRSFGPVPILPTATTSAPRSSATSATTLVSLWPAPPTTKRLAFLMADLRRSSPAPEYRLRLWLPPS